MPIYEFIDDDSGESRDEFFAAAEAPAIGSYIERDGRKWRRVFSADLARAEIERVTHKYPFVSRSLPAKAAPGLYKQDAAGRPIITSQRHEREVLDTLGWQRVDWGV